MNAMGQMSGVVQNQSAYRQVAGKSDGVNVGIQQNQQFQQVRIINNL